MQCDPLKRLPGTTEVTLAENALVTVTQAAAAPPVVKEAPTPEGGYPRLHLHLCTPLSYIADAEHADMRMLLGSGISL